MTGWNLVAAGSAVVGIVIYFFGSVIVGGEADVFGVAIACSAPFWVAFGQLLSVLERIRSAVSVTARYYKSRLPPVKKPLA